MDLELRGKSSVINIVKFLSAMIAGTIDLESAARVGLRSSTVELIKQFQVPIKLTEARCG